MFSARSSGTRVCLLMFDRNTHLMGYFIGEPIQVSEGQWQMDVVSCDYDFTQLYEDQLAAFEGSWEEDFSNYIPPEEIESSGVVWFLNGYNTRARCCGRMTPRSTTCGPCSTRRSRSASAGRSSGWRSSCPTRAGGAAICCWMRTMTCWATPCWTTRETGVKPWHTNAPTAARTCRKTLPSAPTVPGTSIHGERRKSRFRC